MIPIFIKSKSFGLVDSDKLARIHSSKVHFLNYGALQGQVRKNFVANGPPHLKKWGDIPKQKKGLKAPLSIDS
jgi:hypothetical protein